MRQASVPKVDDHRRPGGADSEHGDKDGRWISMRLDGLVVVAELIDRFEADLLAAALRSEQIPVTINEDSRRSMLGGGLLGPGTHGADPVVEVLVPAEREDEAREVIAASLADEVKLPASFRDEEIAAWSEGVAGHTNRRRNLTRRWVLGWIYLLFAVVVIILVIGALNAGG
jgi:hypothetical protein